MTKGTESELFLSPKELLFARCSRLFIGDSLKEKTKALQKNYAKGSCGERRNSVEQWKLQNGKVRRVYKSKCDSNDPYSIIISLNIICKILVVVEYDIYVNHVDHVTE